MNKIYNIIFVFCFSVLLFAQDEAGGVGGAYLRMPADARAAALGNATTTLHNDVNASLTNPANIPSLETRQFSSSFQFLSLDRSYQTLSFGVQLPPSAGMSVSWVHAGVDDIIGRNYSNNPTYNYSWSQDAFIIGFGLKVNEFLSFGLSGKIVSDKLVNSSSSGFSADIGINIHPIKGLNLAVVAKDITGKVTWDTSSEPYVDYQIKRVDDFPLSFHFAASYILMDRVLFTGVYKYSEQIEPTWHIGVEGRIGEAIFVRAGVDNTSPTFGVGTTYRLWKNISTRMDYAFLPGMIHQGSSHLFTWLFYF